MRAVVWLFTCPSVVYGLRDVQPMSLELTQSWPVAFAGDILHLVHIVEVPTTTVVIAAGGTPLTYGNPARDRQIVRLFSFAVPCPVQAYSGQHGMCMFSVRTLQAFCTAHSSAQPSDVAVAACSGCFEQGTL